MVPMHITLQNDTTYANYGMHGIINACHTTYIWHGINACHTILWHGNNSCHSIALCQYVTLWHEANACHRYEIRQHSYIWHGINAGHTLGHNVTVDTMA